MNVLLLKWLYENKKNASSAVHEIRRRNNLLRGPMSTKVIRAEIKRFEEASKLVHSERSRKRITPRLVDGVKTAIDAQSQILEFGGCSAHAVSREICYSYNTVQKVLRKYNALLPIHDPPNLGIA
ncbi:hypothetical protein TNCV_175151 [Trichonephila clavipes]|nr:hypothetical protein TNCV_175151 [Trichonephila clavipes]